MLDVGLVCVFFLTDTSVSFPSIIPSAKDRRTYQPTSTCHDGYKQTQRERESTHTPTVVLTELASNLSPPCTLYPLFPKSRCEKGVNRKQAHQISSTVSLASLFHSHLFMLLAKRLKQEKKLENPIISSRRAHSHILCWVKRPVYNF